jgi:hypothetical protein
MDGWMDGWKFKAEIYNFRKFKEISIRIKGQ